MVIHPVPLIFRQPYLSMFSALSKSQHHSVPILEYVTLFSNEVQSCKCRQEDKTMATESEPYSERYVDSVVGSGWLGFLPKLGAHYNLSFPSLGRGRRTQFQLAVYGNNFAQGAIVKWNGSNRVTAESDVDTVLYATILASDIASVGTATVTVVNPGAGGGISNPVAFTILSKNPAPILNSISPSTLPVARDRHDTHDSRFQFCWHLNGKMEWVCSVNVL